MTAPAAVADVKVDGAERLQVLCVPYQAPEMIGALDDDGRLVLFRESFDEASWSSLPERAAFVDSHNRERPVGWANLHSETDGLHADVELINTSAARDTLEQVKAGLRIGCSIAFTSDDKRDQWSKPPGSRRLPEVLRRGVVLEEVSIVARPAYAAARVLAISHESWQRQASEAIMKPYRAQRQRQESQERQQQRAQDQALLQELDQLAAVCWSDDAAGEALRGAVSHDAQPQAGSPQPGADNGVVVQLGWRRYAVRGAASLADAQQRARTAVQLENFPRGDMPFGVHYRWYGVTPLDND